MAAKRRVDLGAECSCRETADANGDPVCHAVAGAAFERMAEAVSEIEQQPFILIELVDLDEPLLRPETEFDRSLDITRIERDVIGKTLLAAREANLCGLAFAGRYMLRRQGFDRPHRNNDLIGRAEGSNEVLDRADVDRALAADAAVDHRKQGRRKQRPFYAAHVNSGDEAGDILNHAAAERDDAPVARQRLLAALLNQRPNRLELLRFLGRVDEDDGPVQALKLSAKERVGEDQRAIARCNGLADRCVSDPYRVAAAGRPDFKQVAHSGTLGRPRQTGR